jgi:hypothetical protein
MKIKLSLSKNEDWSVAKVEMTSMMMMKRDVLT